MQRACVAAFNRRPAGHETAQQLTAVCALCYVSCYVPDFVCVRHISRSVLERLFCTKLQLCGIVLPFSFSYSQVVFSP